MSAVSGLEVEGLDRWPAAPFLLVCNHHNGADPLIVLAATPSRPPITWFGPKEADFRVGFKNRVMALRRAGVIPFTPDKRRLRPAVRAVGKVFAAGGVLGVFAEGRIGRRGCDLLPFEDGAAYFAARFGVPVVPCAIVGTGELNRRDGGLWLRKRLRVRFGPTIPAGGAGEGGQRGARPAGGRGGASAAADRGAARSRGGGRCRWLTELLN